MEISSEIKLRNDSLIEAFSLTVQPARKGKIYLGSKEIERFIIVDESWEPLAFILGRPQRLENIAKKMDRSLFDTKMIILTLVENSLIKLIDGKRLVRKKGVLEGPQKITFRLARLLISKPLVVIYLVIASLALIMPLFDSNLIPSPDDFFWHERFSVSFLTFFVLNWTFGVFHEFAHYFVALSRGVTSRFRVSHRLNFLVLETTYPNIFSMEKGWRLATFTAGIVFDLMAITILNILLLLYRDNALLKQVLLSQWLTFLWQFLFFMKTDIYFIIKEFVGVENLYPYAKQMLSSFVQKKPFDFPLGQRAKLTVALYALFFIFGTLVAVVRYGLYYLPIVVRLIFGAVENLIYGLTFSDITSFFDGLVVLTIEVVAFALFIFSIIRSRRVSG